MAPFMNKDIAMNRGLIADCLPRFHFNHEVRDIVFLHQVTRCIIPEDNSLLKINISAVAMNRRIFPIVLSFL
jgi:hypothetical protein